MQAVPHLVFFHSPEDQREGFSFLVEDCIFLTSRVQHTPAQSKEDDLQCQLEEPYDALIVLSEYMIPIANLYAYS